MAVHAPFTDQRLSMTSVLLIFAHPALERSRVHRRMIAGLDTVPGVTVRDLYQLYPDFYIDVGREQELLLQHDTVIWQFPLYWYSVPPLLKQYIDLTLEHDWAYGTRGIYLRGKPILNVLTAGGGLSSYCARGHNEYTIREFLRPLEQTARLCGMDYLPPYVVHGTHRLDDTAIKGQAAAYHSFIRALANDEITTDNLRALAYSSDATVPSRSPQL